jgi:hypothetical protein
MAFTKTERMRLRVTEDMLREVRALADLQHRSIQDQARYLMAIGLEHSRRGASKERRAEVRAAASPSVPSEAQPKAQMSLPGTVGPIPAPRRRTA